MRNRVARYLRLRYQANWRHVGFLWTCLCLSIEQRTIQLCWISVNLVGPFISLECCLLGRSNRKTPCLGTLCGSNALHRKTQIGTYLWERFKGEAWISLNPLLQFNMTPVKLFQLIRAKCSQFSKSFSCLRALLRSFEAFGVRCTDCCCSWAADIS